MEFSINTIKKTEPAVIFEIKINLKTRRKTAILCKNIAELQALQLRLVHALNCYTNLPEAFVKMIDQIDYILQENSLWSSTPFGSTNCSSFEPFESVELTIITTGESQYNELLSIIRTSGSELRQRMPQCFKVPRCEIKLSCPSTSFTSTPI